VFFPKEVALFGEWIHIGRELTICEIQDGEWKVGTLRNYPHQGLKDHGLM